MYSQDSEQVSERNRGIITVFGMYFCTNCENMLQPSKANGSILEFVCPTCGRQNIDFTRRSDKECMLYSKQLQVGSKKYVPNLDYIFDPTMPSVEVECPDCGNNRAVYFLTPDEGESKIVAKMICASATGTTAKCGHIWDLDQNTLLQRTCAISQYQDFS